jgi:glycosyltransferase involved in cell wall biosynthesis
LRVSLNDGIKQLAISSFQLASPTQLLDILGWGIDPEYLQQPGVDVDYYHEFAELILAGLDRQSLELDLRSISAQAFTAIDYLRSVPSTSILANYIAAKINLIMDKPEIPTGENFHQLEIVPSINLAIEQIITLDRQQSVLVYVITKSELGGAQGHVHDLIKSLYQDREIHLIVGSLGWLTDRCEELGVTVHHLPKLTRNINLVKDLIAVKEFVSLIQQIKPDIIHAHSGKPGVIARLAGKICNIPVIFTAHGWGFDPNAPLLRRTVALGIERLLGKFATKIICVSESDRQLAIDLGVVTPDRVIAIHNGIDLETNLPTATPEINPPQLIMVARFNKQQKDQYTLMKAIQTIEQDLNVLLVGTGPDWEEAKNIAQELGISAKVKFLGDRLDVPDLLAQSQIFVLTTHYEGLPISILEAMRAGLPIIATNVNGIPEQVVDGITGLLVERQDIDGLAKAIVTLVNDHDLRKRMGAAAIQKLHQEFTIDQMVLATDSLYRSVVGHHLQLDRAIGRLSSDYCH